MKLLLSLLLLGIFCSCNQSSSNDVEKLKLEIEKLKLENERVKLGQQGKSSAEDVVVKKEDIRIELVCDSHLTYKRMNHPEDPNRTRDLCLDKKNIAQGPYINYFSSGEVQGRGSFLDGKIHGDYIGFHKNGQKESAGFIKNAKSDGLWTYWHPNGSKSSEGKYLDDLQEGQWTGWYENGEKEEEGVYKKSVKDGKWMFWYANGNKKFEGNYVNGEAEGNWLAWSENGNHPEKQFYKNGNLIDLVSEAYEVEEKGLLRTESLKLNPTLSLDKTVKLYGYIDASDYYNYRYRNANGSHYSLNFSHNSSGTGDINLYLRKDKGEEFVEKILKQKAKSANAHYGPVTIILTKLKSRSSSSNDGMYELLHIEDHINKKLPVDKFKVPSLTDQLGIKITKLESRWNIQGRITEKLHLPVVRLYFTNVSKIPVGGLEFNMEFILVDNKESWGTNTGSMGDSEKLQPGNMMWIDLESPRGFTAYDSKVPLIKGVLKIGELVLGYVNISSSKNETLVLHEGIH
ncbi:MAG: toxin-antitoxin system YwqK family antitoxin [Bdellovibrionales bacterium]|nr:toxin-antitoxin system YwqK family antitoxin [Bdellovibrionales bacterium]